MPRAKPAPFKATIRTDTMTVNISGSHSLGVTQTFLAIKSREERAALLEGLRDLNEKMNAAAEVA